MMPNITGLLARAGINTIWRWPFYVVGIGVISFAWRRKVDLENIAFGVAVTLLIAPHLHLADTDLLVVAGWLLPAIAFPLASVALIATNQNPIVGALIIVFVGTACIIRPARNIPN
jgi:hypothetical protein